MIKSESDYSFLLKAHVALLALKGESSLEELSKRYDIPVSLIKKWAHQVKCNQKNR